MEIDQLKLSKEKPKRLKHWYLLPRWALEKFTAVSGFLEYLKNIQGSNNEKKKTITFKCICRTKKVMWNPKYCFIKLQEISYVTYFKV